MDRRRIVIYAISNSISWNGNRRDNYITFSKYNLVALGQEAILLHTPIILVFLFTGLGSTIFSTSGNVLLCYKNKWIAGGSGTNVLAYSENSKDWFISIHDNIFSEVHGLVISTKINQISLLPWVMEIIKLPTVMMLGKVGNYSPPVQSF